MFFDGLQYLLKGGPVMWPLFICAIVSVTVIIERTVALKRAAAGNQELILRVRSRLLEGRDELALRDSVQHGGPVGRLIAHAIANRDRDFKAIERSLEEQSIVETPLISQRLGTLDTIITIAPLLGLLGTVTGMIRAFGVISDPGALNGPAAITGGVAEALIATATGLAIAIVTLVGYNSLGEKVKAIVSSMELGATQVINIYADRQAGERTHEDSVARV